jgi:hypothetical protein
VKVVDEVLTAADLPRLPKVDVPAAPARKAGTR